MIYRSESGFKMTFVFKIENLEISIDRIQFYIESRYVSHVLKYIDNHDSLYIYARYTPKGTYIIIKW